MWSRHGEAADGHRRARGLRRSRATTRRWMRPAGHALQRASSGTEPVQKKAQEQCAKPDVLERGQASRARHASRAAPLRAPPGATCPARVQCGPAPPPSPTPAPPPTSPAHVLPRRSCTARLRDGNSAPSPLTRRCFCRLGLRPRSARRVCAFLFLKRPPGASRTAAPARGFALRCVATESRPECDR